MLAGGGDGRRGPDPLEAPAERPKRLRTTELKPASKRTPQEQALYQSSVLLQRQGLDQALQANQKELAVLIPLIQESRRSILHGEVELDRLLRQLESLKQQQVKNENSFFRRALSRAVGTDVDIAKQIAETDKEIKKKQELANQSIAELQTLLRQKKSLENEQKGWQTRAQFLDQERRGFAANQAAEAEETVEEIEPEPSPFGEMELKDLKAEAKARQAEQRMLREELALVQKKRMELNDESEELFDALDKPSEQGLAIAEEMGKLNERYDKREEEIKRLQKQREALTTSAWSRWRNKEDIASLDEAMVNLWFIIEDINDRFKELGKQQQQEADRLHSPARHIATLKKAELDTQINRLMDKEVDMQRRIAQSESEVAEIQKRMETFSPKPPPPASRRTSRPPLAA